MEKVNQEFYNEAYYKGENSNYDKDYWDWGKSKDRFIAEARTIVNLCKPTRVLDVGCGLGGHVKAFNELGVEAHGVDCSDYAIKNKLHKNCKFRDIAFDKLAGDGQFDLVTVVDVLEHLDKYEIPLAVKNVCEVASKFIFLSIPVMVEPAKTDFSDKSHVSIFPVDYWIQKFRENDFHSVIVHRQSQNNFIVLFYKVEDSK